MTSQISPTPSVTVHITMPAINRYLSALADLLHKQDALDAQRRARVEELLSGIVRAWYADFWDTGKGKRLSLSYSMIWLPSPNNCKPARRCWRINWRQTMTTAASHLPVMG